MVMSRPTMSENTLREASNHPSTLITVLRGKSGPHGLAFVVLFSLMGPFFFDGNVNGRNYLAMFNDEILPSLLRFYGLKEEADIQNIWWFQN